MRMCEFVLAPSQLCYHFKPGREPRSTVWQCHIFKLLFGDMTAVLCVVGYFVTQSALCHALCHLLSPLPWALLRVALFPVLVCAAASLLDGFLCNTPPRYGWQAENEKPKTFNGENGKYISPKERRDPGEVGWVARRVASKLPGARDLGLGNRRC